MPSWSGDSCPRRLFSLIAIAALVSFVRTRTYQPFAWYRIAIAILVIAVAFARKSESAQIRASRPRSRHHRHSRAFQIGFAMAITNTLIGATQPVLTRYAAVRLDPILFCAAVTTIAAICALPILYRRGELRDALRSPLPRASDRNVDDGYRNDQPYADLRDAAHRCDCDRDSASDRAGLFADSVGHRGRRTTLIAPTYRDGAILAGIGSVFWAGNSFAPMFAAMLLFVTPFFWQTSHVIGLRVMPPLTPICVAGRALHFRGLHLRSDLSAALRLIARATRRPAPGCWSSSRSASSSTSCPR